MDELNNKNPFDEQDTSGSDYDPYNQPKQETAGTVNLDKNSSPYGQPQQNNPYNQPYQQPYNQQGVYYNQVNTPQQGYSYPQYGGSPYQPYAPQNQSTGMAVASLVLGIISICIGLFMWSFPILFLLPIIGLILGIVYKTKHLPVGKGLSTAGIVTSAVGLVIPIVFLIIMVVVLLVHGDALMEYIREISPEQYEEFYEMYGDQFPQWFESVFMLFK